jgi:hypothetical protein
VRVFNRYIYIYMTGEVKGSEVGFGNAENRY